MTQVQVEQKSYQMPPQDGFTVAHFLTVADIERSARFYQTVFGGRILSRGDGSGAPDGKPSDLMVIILTAAMANRGVIPESVLGFAAAEPGVGGRIAYVIYDRVKDITRGTHVDDMRMMGIIVRSLEDAQRKLRDARIEFTFEHGLTAGEERLLLLDPAGNWIRITQSTQIM